MKGLKERISLAVKTGKVVLGSKKVIYHLLMSNPKLIILSENCNREIRDRIKYYSKLSGVPCKTIIETSIELGSMCGNPFSVSTLAIIDQGDSDILEIIK